MLKSAWPVGLSLLTIFVLLIFYSTFSDVSRSLSPQGCRMSWMSPSYVLQSQFNSSHTPLGSRYSLWLYREVGWDASEITGDSAPVLFIPGNAGSCRQIRSIASSATRQYHSSPRVIATEFASQSLKPLDFFTVEFNEDLSAFHGTTLKSQIAYISSATKYILSLYPNSTSIIIVGHSMGGIVSTSLLPFDRISAIITLSAPHTLPPARFDARIDEIYRTNMQALLSEPTPIVSLCGGAADMMIPSESCILPSSVGDIYRKTVFTSALEGAWTGVGHQEMVWCHQVRWRIARAALELGKANTPSSRGLVLDKWLRDGHTLPPALGKEGQLMTFHNSTYEIISAGQQLRLQGPIGTMMYLMSIPQNTTKDNPSRFVLLASQGSIGPVSPHNPYPLSAFVYTCSSFGQDDLGCRTLRPTTLKLVPNPSPGQTFPVPDEGANESEGVVLYETELDGTSGDAWLGVRIENGDGRGWVVGGFSHEYISDSELTTTSLVLGGRSKVILNSYALSTTVMIPRARQHALLVYRLVSGRPITPCPDTLLSPLIMHTPHSVETHYFPLHHPPERRILLHTHAPAPFIEQSLVDHPGLNFTVYSVVPRSCGLLTIEIMIDWSATIGRWVCRYPTTIGIWATGITALLMFNAWRVEDKTKVMPTVEESLSTYIRHDLPALLVCATGLSALPLPARYYLGNSGEKLLLMIAPLLLIVSSGLVCISWWLLLGLAWMVNKVGRLFCRSREVTGPRRTTIISMVVLFVSIFLLIPWQVAFLVAWMIHLRTCASSLVRRLWCPSSTSYETAVSPITVPVYGPTDTHRSPSYANHAEFGRRFPSKQANNDRHNWHLLLFMTWLLPLVAPVLVVWVRTLATAGYTTPFDGDHNFLVVAPFLILVDFASWTPGPLFVKHSIESRISTRWLLAVVALTAFFLGSRRSYDVFNSASITFAVIVIARVGRMYLTMR